MTAMRALLVVVASLVTVVQGARTSQGEWEAKAARWPWFNSSLPLEERLQRLVTAMSGDELITQLVKYSQRIDRLGVPAYAWHMEAAHGVVTGGDATSFPCSLARAAAFNPELEHQIAQVIGVEARAKWNDFIRLHGASPAYHSEGLALTLYAPEINLCRDPRWGRCQGERTLASCHPGTPLMTSWGRYSCAESRGEDPELTARLTVPFVRGLQYHAASNTTLLTTAMLKDFVVYNVESNEAVGGYDWQYRLSYNAVVSNADLRQTFLPAFEAGAIEGGVRSMMTSYHALNGVPTSASPFIQSELRDRLGWNGMMMSDGGAITFMLTLCDATPPLNLSMCKNLTTAAAAAIKAGTDINSGGGTDTKYRKDNPPHRVIQNMSGYAYEYLGDALDEGLVDLQRLRIAATRTLRLRFELGLFDEPLTGPFSHFSVAKDVDSAAHRALARTSASESLVLLRNAGGFLPLNADQLKHVALIGPNANNSAALLSNYAGCGASQTRSAVNRFDPGKPCRLVTPLQGLQLQLPSHVKLSYTEGSTLNQTLEGGEQAARNAAAAADVAVLVVGLQAWPGGRFSNLSKSELEGSDPTEGEAHDRVDLRLTDAQHSLVAAVLDAQPRTVLVIMSGGPVSEPRFMSGVGAAPAVIQAFYGGEEHGNALASHLLGHTAFSGRLPVTIVASEAQLPSYLNQQMSLAPGRTHRYLTQDPLYSFGFGLTSGAALASYSGASVSPSKISASAQPQNLTVRVDVSALRGADRVDLMQQASLELPTEQIEIVQVYAGWQAPSVDAREAGEASVPLHQLVSFRRVQLGALTSPRTIEFEIPLKKLSLMQPSGEIGLMRGLWKIWIGGTSPRTPAGLLRGSAGASTGAPEPPVSVELRVEA